MKAITYSKYGLDALELQEIDKPDPADEEVLVRVRAASVNRAEWYSVAGTPYAGRVMFGLLRPKSNRAAAVPMAAPTALQGLRDKGQLQPGQKVLINGASGGVGTFAVQVAKALGAEVTGVCSTRNVDLVRSIRADRVVDYTREDFTQSGERYDVIFDVAGSRSWSEFKRVLSPQAIVVLAGGPKDNPLIGPLGHVVRVRLAGLRSRQKVVFFIAKFNKADMEVLREFLEAGKVTPVIDKRFELSEIADALRYMGEGHARGKVVVTV